MVARNWGADAEPVKFSGARPDGRDPALFGSVLNNLLARHGWTDELAVASVTARWAEVVGPDVAAHTTVEDIELVTDAQAPAITDPGTTGSDSGTDVPERHARLVVRAESTAWATQLRLLSPALRRRLVEELNQLSRVGSGSHDPGWQVDITVLGPTAPSWRKGPKHVSGRGPRDTYG